MCVLVPTNAWAGGDGDAPMENDAEDPCNSDWEDPDNGDWEGEYVDLRRHSCFTGKKTIQKGRSFTTQIVAAGGSGFDDLSEEEC